MGETPGQSWRRVGVPPNPYTVNNPVTLTMPKATGTRDHNRPKDDQ